MHGIGEAIKGAFIATGIVAAVVGWAVIEGLIWVFSNVSIVWGG